MPINRSLSVYRMECYEDEILFINNLLHYNLKIFYALFVFLRLFNY